MQSVIFLIAAVSASSYTYERKLASVGTGMYFEKQKLTDNQFYGSCYAKAFTYYTSFACDAAGTKCVQSYCDSMIDPTDTSAAVAKAA